MARRIDSLWRRRRRSAVQLAERDFATIAKSFPVDLGEIATRRRVRRIEFHQLLTQGGLAVHEDGFIIYVRCDPGQEADLTARFMDDGTGSTLPESIVHRARFTIAHEIAHTFFYDVTAVPPVPKIDVKDTAGGTRLELACNEIAGLLVLPQALIRDRLGKLECISPEDLRRLADDAFVSPQAVVRRFHQSLRANHPQAIFAAVSYGKRGWIIDAISRHYSLRGIMPNAKMGSAATALIDDLDFALFGGDRRDATIEYVGHGGKRKNMKFECEARPALRRLRGVFVVGQPA
jgi:hypothetical protein